jgi:hypothetical protein
MSQALLAQSIREKILSITGVAAYIADRCYELEYDAEGSGGTFPYVTFEINEDDEDEVFSGWSRGVKALLEVKIYGLRRLGARNLRTLAEIIYNGLRDVTMTDASPNFACSILGLKKGKLERDENAYVISQEYLICGTIVG